MTIALKILSSLLLTSSVALGMHAPAPELDANHEALLATIPAHEAEQVRIYVAKTQEKFEGHAQVSLNVQPLQRQILVFVGIPGDPKPENPTEFYLIDSCGASFSWEEDE